MPYRKRDIQENRPPIRPHCPHFVFLLFMAIPHERKLAHLLQIEESVTHFFFPSLERIPSNDIQKNLQLLAASSFLAFVSAYSHVESLYSTLVFCTYTMQYTLQTLFTIHHSLVSLALKMFHLYFLCLPIFS